jgi:putative transposase
MHVEYAPKQNSSSISKSLKGRTCRESQMKFPELKNRYWGKHFWASGYGVWRTGNITDEMVNEYLEHHRRKDGDDNSNFILK